MERGSVGSIQGIVYPLFLELWYRVKDKTQMGLVGLRALHVAPRKRLLDVPELVTGENSVAVLAFFDSEDIFIRNLLEHLDSHLVDINLLNEVTGAGLEVVELVGHQNIVSVCESGTSADGGQR